MKGISLPISAIVIFALALIVLLAVSTFFMTTGGKSMSKIEAQQIFEEQCPRYKCTYSENNFNPSKEFLEACKILYGIEEKEKIKCLWFCNCGLEADICKVECIVCNKNRECLNMVKNKYPQCEHHEACK